MLCGLLLRGQFEFLLSFMWFVSWGVVSISVLFFFGSWVFLSSSGCLVSLAWCFSCLWCFAGCVALFGWLLVWRWLCVWFCGAGLLACGFFSFCFLGCFSGACCLGLCVCVFGVFLFCLCPFACFLSWVCLAPLLCEEFWALFKLLKKKLPKTIYLERVCQFQLSLFKRMKQGWAWLIQ